MKAILSAFTWCLMVALVLAACVQDKTYPSPLEGIVVQDITIEADEQQKVVELNAELPDVAGRALDTSTGDIATWLTVSASDTRLTLKVQENTTIRDRVAVVTLYMANQREDVDNADLTVSFRVTQKMNRQFEGLDIQELTLASQSRDTIVALGRTLKNVVAQVESPNERSVDWCSARMKDNNAISIHVNEHLSAGERYALIRLKPRNGTADSLTASLAFLVTQQHNPVLDSLTLETANLTHEGTRQVIHTGRTLKGIKSIVNYYTNGKDDGWCNVSVAGDSISVGASKLIAHANRTAWITLYLPNKGATIDTTTLQYTFTVVQHYNSVFDGLNIPDHTLEYDQKRASFKLDRQMKDIKATVVDSRTQKAVNWLKVSADGDSVVLQPTVHKNKQDREAQVTLFYSDKNVPDSNAVKTSFLVRQQHNTVFDAYQEMSIQPLKLAFNQTYYMQRMAAQMKDIKTKVRYATTSETNWLTAKAAGDSLVLGASVFKNINERVAFVTLYYPNGGEVVNDSMVYTTVEVRQQSNPVFTGITLEDMTVGWAQNEYHKDFLHDPTGIKWLLTDLSTQKAASWLSASLSGMTLTLKTKNNTDYVQRSAKVLLYYPNGNDASKATVRDSFVLVQTPKPQFSVTPKKLTFGYEAKMQSEQVTIRSNMGAVVSNSAYWLRMYRTNEPDGITTKLSFQTTENQTDEERQAKIFVRADVNSTNEQLTDTVTVTQTTNPKITLFDGNVTTISFRKGESSFDLPVHTLTRGYKIAKKASWISVGSQSRAEQGLYYNKISLKRFSGAGFERKDTLVVKNDVEACSLVVVQDKYIYLDESEKELEVGSQFQLNATNGTSHSITWSSGNNKVAKVDQNGLVSGVGRGTTTVSASIGEYNEVLNYNDFCTVKVYDATDKVEVRHGYGDYVKNDGFVTSNCPVAITNNYRSAITLKSVYVVADGGETVINGNITQQSVGVGKQATVRLNASLYNAYEPKAVVVFSVNGKDYTKTVNF